MVEITFSCISVSGCLIATDFAHGTTALLSWHVQNFAAIISIKFEKNMYIFLMILGPFRKNGINIMAVDALDHYIAKPSATMGLIM